MCELFSEKKYRRGNHLVQKKKGNKEGRKEYFHKINYPKTVTVQKDRRNFKASKLLVIIMKT